MVGDDEHVRVAHQLDRLERAGLERVDAEAHVGLAALDELQQLAVVGRLDEADVDLGPFGGEAREQPGEDACADRLVGADAERTGIAGGERLEVGARRLQSRHDPLRVTEEQGARLRQGHGPRTSGALDQTLADDALEGCDLLTDRRLRVAEPLRGTAE